MKNFFLKKLPLSCVALMLVICMVFSGCASRRSVTAEDFTAACESAGFAVEDITANYDASAMSSAMFYSDDGHVMAYYNFAKASEAKSQYAQLFSSLSQGTSDEKYIDSAEYNRFYATAAGSVALLYRNGTTLIYVVGTEDDAIMQVIENLGV